MRLDTKRRIFFIVFVLQGFYLFYFALGLMFGWFVDSQMISEITSGVIRAFQGFALIILSIFFFVCARGIWGYRKYGRTLAIILASGVIAVCVIRLNPYLVPFAVTGGYAGYYLMFDVETRDAFNR